MNQELAKPIADKPEGPPFLTWRMVADQLAQALLLTRDYVQPAVDLPEMEGWSWYDAIKLYEYLKADDDESNMIAHARRELTLADWYKPDPDGLHTDQWADSMIAAVAEITHYGHSGGTIGFAVGMLEDLIMFKPLSPLTSNPDEWQEVTEYMDGTPCWQSRRNPSVFSYDGGKTWVDYDDPRWRKKHWWNFKARWYRHKWNKQRNKPLKPLPEPEQP